MGVRPRARSAWPCSGAPDPKSTVPSPLSHGHVVGGHFLHRKVESGPLSYVTSLQGPASNREPMRTASMSVPCLRWYQTPSTWHLAPSTGHLAPTWDTPETRERLHPGLPRHTLLQEAGACTSYASTVLRNRELLAGRDIWSMCVSSALSPAPFSKDGPVNETCIQAHFDGTFTCGISKHSCVIRADCPSIGTKLDE